MFEIAILSIIVLAVGYWVTLWLMNRHDDVLHGDFVHAEQGTEGAMSAFPAPPFPPRPPFPPKPVLTKASPVRPALKSSAVKPSPVMPAAVRPATMPAPAETPSPSAFSERSDTLQALLASIKRDLKDASQL